MIEKELIFYHLCMQNVCAGMLIATFDMKLFEIKMKGLYSGPVSWIMLHAI